MLISNDQTCPSPRASRRASNSPALFSLRRDSRRSRAAAVSRGRFCRGERGPQPKDWKCDSCGRPQEDRQGGRCRGPKGPGTLCASCGSRYGKSRRATPASRAPSRSSCPACQGKHLAHTCGRVKAPGVGELKVALAKVTRERDEAQDRNECIVCMERPRAVLFMPCNHLLVCATCAAAADACPWCPARAVEGRITVANSS